MCSDNRRAAAVKVVSEARRQAPRRRSHVRVAEKQICPKQNSVPTAVQRWKSQKCRALNVGPSFAKVQSFVQSAVLRRKKQSARIARLSLHPGRSFVRNAVLRQNRNISAEESDISSRATVANRRPFD